MYIFFSEMVPRLWTGCWHLQVDTDDLGMPAETEERQAIQQTPVSDESWGWIQDHQRFQVTWKPVRSLFKIYLWLQVGISSARDLDIFYI